MIVYCENISMFWLQFSCCHHFPTHLRNTDLVPRWTSALSIDLAKNNCFHGATYSDLVMSVLTLRSYEGDSNVISLFYFVKKGYKFS